MKLSEHKKSVQFPLRQATLCFLTREDEVLLAMKKRGFGEGRWNGPGGKVMEGESHDIAAQREFFEETEVTLIGLVLVGILDFYFLHKPEWNQQVLVYKATDYEGEPCETEEMFPKWWSIGRLPFDKMWPDDKHWLPLVLAGKMVQGEFLFGENDGIVDFQVLEVRNLQQP